ncbi:hypothetical protein GGR54DRAFT_641207 [Hypoxylon sp. NC1633]|nr:hypothetical protein GGR54DRAFT_641207 [Hypoxylon sp. NC1633]
MATATSVRSEDGPRPINAPRPLMATAPEFSPASTGVVNEVLDATFFSHTIPDITYDTGVVGLCAVSSDEAGPDRLGWHIADFLAFKALLRGETHHQAQTWLAQCDVAGIVNANPEGYAHGKDRRLVNGAADASSFDDKGSLKHREDHIKVETVPDLLMDMFIKDLEYKAKVARHGGYPLIVIICGPTSLEQDIFFRQDDIKHHLTRDDIRKVLGSDIDVTVVTPALFSAGWQINPSFCKKPAGEVRADRTEFLARQLGGIFAKNHVDNFLGLACPLLDRNRVDEDVKQGEFFGPVMPSEEQKELAVALKVKVHNALASRLSVKHDDHSFDLNDANDDWERLIGPRRTQLSYFGQKWANLEGSKAPVTDEEKLGFLGGAFGGNKASQVHHIHHLIKESFDAWPGYWNLPFGQKVRTVLNNFLQSASPESRDCHEIFNIMEHRATTAVLADALVEYFKLPKPHGLRCRDWDEPKWVQKASHEGHLYVVQSYKEVSKRIPAAIVPPEVNVNHLSVIQRRLEVPVVYLSVSLCVCDPKSEGSLQAVVKHIDPLFKDIMARQVQLLLGDPELQATCVAWLRSIQMPVRYPTTATESMDLVKTPATVLPPEMTAGGKGSSTGTNATVVPAAVPSGGQAEDVVLSTPVQPEAEPLGHSDVRPDQHPGTQPHTPQTIPTKPDILSECSTLLELLDGGVTEEGLDKILPVIDIEFSIAEFRKRKDEFINELVMATDRDEIKGIQMKVKRVTEILNLMVDIKKKVDK